MHDRKHRDRTRLFLVEGLRLVEEAALAGGWLEQLVIAPDSVSDWDRLDRVCTRGRVSVLEVSAEVLASISPRHCHDGVVGVARQRFAELHELAAPHCAVAMSRLTEPWTIGNILRICDAAGAYGVVLLGHSTDPYYPAAVRASLGAVFSQPLVRAVFSQLAAWKEHHGCLLVGTSPDGEADYREADYRRPAVVLTGGERVGLTPEQQAACDLVVRIPMVGRCESHHVTVATALVLYEVVRQQKAGLPRAADAAVGRAGGETPRRVWNP